MTDQSGPIEPIKDGFPDEELEHIMRMDEIQRRLRQSDHTSIGQEELRERFLDHTSNELTDTMRSAVQSIFLDGAITLDRMLPNGRAKFQAIMQLELSCMWAKKAIDEMSPVSDD